MLESIQDLYNLVCEQMENMAICTKASDREFFYRKYKRIKIELDRCMDELAEGLKNFDVL